MQHGDELKLVHPEQEWSGLGVVRNFVDGEITLELQMSEGYVPSRAKGGRSAAPRGRGGRAGGVAKKPPITLAEGYEGNLFHKLYIIFSWPMIIYFNL
jgi:hypothetical protein|tara:strand:+ start:370 stop:663 length:294 start_codon:yes stop_codon:yes gene_type:complete